MIYPFLEKSASSNRPHNQSNIDLSIFSRRWEYSHDQINYSPSNVFDLSLDISLFNKECKKGRFIQANRYFIQANAEGRKQQYQSFFNIYDLHQYL